MNCMALDLPCAPIGHILGMFSPRSMSTTGGRPIPCKFTGVYAASSSTPRLTAWSKNSAQDFSEDLPRIPPSYSKTDFTDVELQEYLHTETPCSEEGLDTDSGHSSDSGDSGSADSGYTMPLASEAFETVLLELKEEEEIARRELEADTTLSDCSDDSYDFGVHAIYSESPTLDRSTSRVKDSECSQFCCNRGNERPTESLLISEDSEDSSLTVPRRVRFADHMHSINSLKAIKKAPRPKVSKDIKPILKLSPEWR